MTGRVPRTGGGAVYRREVTPEHVGRRVSIRRWVDDPERGTVPSDVVGHLRSHDGTTLVVERRDGTLVAVEAARLLASKLVPDPPTRARG